MSTNAEKVITELDRLVPGLLDYVVELNFKPHPPSMEDVRKIQHFIPGHLTQRVNQLLTDYLLIANEAQGEDAWFIAKRFATTPEEKEVLEKLKGLETRITTLNDLHEKVIAIEAQIQQHPNEGLKQFMLAKVKPQHDRLHEAMAGALSELAAAHKELNDYAGLARGCTVGDC